MVCGSGVVGLPGRWLVRCSAGLEIFVESAFWWQVPARERFHFGGVDAV